MVASDHQLRARDLRRQAAFDIAIDIPRQHGRDAGRGAYAQYAGTPIARRTDSEIAVWPEHIERNVVPPP